MSLIPVTDEVRSRVLSPYKAEATYLLRAAVDPSPREEALVSANGEFTIPFSCYIADTGHFNAVEFNICYNQLAYVLLGQCVISGLLPELEIATFEEYRRRQLPDFLILRLKSSFRQAAWAPVGAARRRNAGEPSPPPGPQAQREPTRGERAIRPAMTGAVPTPARASWRCR